METQKRRPGFLTQYAKHAGISVRAASDQLKRVGIDYFKEFDFAAADRLRAAARHADRVPFSKPIYVSAGDDSPEFLILSKDPNVAADPALKSFAEAQARERHFKAKLAELEYEERVGKLMEKEKIEEEWFRLGRLVRDAVLNVPARVAGILAAESDQQKVHELLESELRQALEALCVEAAVAG
ncbi:MAG: hypothetical protein H8K08_07205 [Nitrospira sp.]|nr:hypothetical protein [Nitrospira sp.]